MTLLSKAIQKIEQKKALIAVVGLGYVGLPFVLEKLKVGFQVIGIDLNAHRVAQLNEGKSYIPDVPTDMLKPFIESKQFYATTHFDDVKAADVIVIAVPTPLTRNLVPDLQYVESVGRMLAPRLTPGQLISLESTTYPGTTEDILLPLLAESGLKVEEDFFLAHSPERVDPGNHEYNTKNTNKVVGAVGPNSLRVAVTFYSQAITHIVPVSSAKAAEFSKIFENTFRAVNIALVNELTLLCDKMGLDIWEILDAAFTKPFGIMPFYPGPGVGGHCIPIDPHYLEWKAKEYNFNTRFISLAGETNRHMPEFVCEKAVRLLNQRGVASRGAKLLLIGVTYKKDIDDFRESPALEVLDLLLKTGALVDYHDPYVSTLKEVGYDLKSVDLTEQNLESYDLAIITTSHSRVDYVKIFEASKQVLDTRYVSKNFPQYLHKIVRL